MPNWIPTPAESLYVALGGALGAYCRLAVSRGLVAAGVATPWPTGAVNVVGAFALGFLAVKCQRSPALLVLLGTGFCGGFTTFSAFGVEVAHLLGGRRYGVVAAYTLASVAGSVAGAVVGLRAGQWAAGR